MDRNFMDFYLFELRFYAEKSFWFQTDPFEAILNETAEFLHPKFFL